MKEISFDTALLEAGDLMKRGYAAAVANAGKIIAALTVIISALVIFADIGFADFCTEKFTSTLIFMLIASYLIYFSMSDAGEKLAEESEEYKETVSRFEKLKASIPSGDMSRLGDYLTEYARAERLYRISSYLSSFGYSEREFFAWLDGEERISDRQKRRAFIRAKRIKAISVTPAALLSGRARTKSELISPEGARLPRMLLRLIPTTFCMLFSASVILTAKDGLTLNTVLDGLVKLSTLPIVGFKGYTQGFEFVKCSRLPWLQTKYRLLEAFHESCAA